MPLSAAVSNYSFSQKQDTIPTLVGGTQFYEGYTNATVYYGNTFQTSGTTNTNNLYFTGIPIGFNFIFDGQVQNVFGINSRGYLVLGYNSINMRVTPATHPISGVDSANVISALAGLLCGAQGANIRYLLTGVAPNRLLSVQWTNMARRYSMNSDSLSFQIRLHESSNSIEIVYNKFSLQKQGADQYFEIGLRGIDSSNFTNRRLIGSWDNSTWGFSKTSTCMLGKNNYPKPGTTFTFTPPDALCSALTLSGSIVPSTFTVAANQPFSLVLDSAALATNLIVEWQKSNDSINWTSIPTSNSRWIFLREDSTHFYRCMLTCGATNYYALPVKIVLLNTTQSYCSSFSRYPDVINIGNVSFSNINNGTALPALSPQVFHSYTDYCNLAPALVTQGANYEMGVKEIFHNNYIKSGVMVFIDYNKDGVFNASDETIFLGKTKSTPAGYVAKSFIQIPDTAPLGLTKMRIVLYDPNTQLPVEPCDATFNGETEDYLIQITAAIACSAVPDTIYTAASVTEACPNVPFRIFLASPLSSGLSYTWFTSSDSINWTAIPNANANYCLITQTQLSFYKCLISCQGNDSTFSIPVKVIASPFYLCYCDYKANNPSDYQIKNVSLSTLDNTSGSKKKLYSNYTSISPTPLVLSGKYTFSIGYESYYYTPNMAITAYIDYDRNGVFGNAPNEVISFGALTYSSQFLNSKSILLTVPPAVSTGITGMRIVYWEINSNPNPNACGVFNHGEVEDYLLSIKTADTCQVPISAGSASAKEITVCKGNVAHLSLIGVNYSPNYSYQWQVSTDSTSWADVPNQTLFTASIVQSVKSYYRCKVGCAENVAFSRLIAIEMSPFINCYCNSAPFPNDVTDIGNIQLAGNSFGKDTLAINPFGGNLYRDFTDSLPPITLERGGYYPMKIIAAKTQSSVGSIQAFVFIDYNHNGVFDSNESYNAGNFPYTPVSAAKFNLLVPDSALLGLTRMRIILLSGYNYFSNIPPCGNYRSDGETADYLINLIAPLPCQPIPAIVPVFSDTVLCLNSLLTMSISGLTAQVTLKYSWQKSTNALVWTTLNHSPSNTFQDTVKGNYYYRCIVSCGNQSDTSASTYISTKPFNVCYCTSTVMYSDQADIGNIQIAGYSYGADTLAGAITNNSYSDNTSLFAPIVLQKGGFYPMKLTAAKSIGFTSHVEASIYLDFNHNSIFDASEKFVIYNFSYFFPFVGNCNIYIPTAAQIGITRMRIVLNAPSYYGYNGPPSCGTMYTYGETEDYFVDIINPLPCQPFGHGTITTPIAFPVCINQQITFNYNNSFYSPVLNYVWQSSLDSVNWTVISNSFSPSLTTNLTSEKYFRCIVTCSPQADTSNCIKIDYIPFYNCYCNSSFYTGSYVDIGNIKINGYNYGADTLPNPVLSNVYTDYTTSLAPINLEQGGHYPMKITAAVLNLNGFLPVATVYIDFNHNASFDFAERTVIKNFTSTFPYEAISQVQLSSNALLGLTRMRIVLSVAPYNSNGTSGCGMNSYYGETEDYLVNIVPPLPCPALNHGYLTNNGTNICPAENFVLTYTGNANLTQAIYTWQTSPNAITWTTSTTSISEIYSALLSTPSYFRCILSCGVNADTTAPVFLQVKPFATCYCTSAALDSSLVDIGFFQLGDFKNGTDTLPLNPGATKRYSDFTGSIAPIQLENGGQYLFFIKPAFTIDTILNVKASVAIDYNHDGFFSSNETTFIDIFQLRFPFLGSGYILPKNAITGTTRLRVKLLAGSDLSTLSPPCASYLYGETEDYLVNIVNTVPACQPLAKGVVKTLNHYACEYTSTGNLFYYSGNPYHSNFTYKWQFSDDGISWVYYPYYTNNAAFIRMNNLNPSWKFLRCIATCAVYKDTSVSFEIKYGSRLDCYCNSMAPSQVNQDIGNVSLGNLSNGNALPFLNNPLSINSHSDFSNIAPTELKQGFVYPISVNQINQNSFRRSKVVAFLDYNANGIYEDAEEFFIGITSDSSAVPGKVTGNVSVPYDADTGITGLRVVLAEKIYKNTIYACGITTEAPYGEVEDYLVKIVSNKNCVLPIAGNAVAPISSYCMYDSVYLQLKNFSQVNGQSYQWQVSSDSSNWNNIAFNTNYPTRTVRIQYPSYYRCIVSCNALQAISTPVFVDLLPQSVCSYGCGYPGTLGGSDCYWNDKITHVKLEGTSLDNADTNCYQVNNSHFYTFPDKGNTTATIGRGKTYKLYVTASKTNNISAWLDFNHDNSFSISEWINVTDSSNANVADSVYITVPMNAALGKTRMRIRSRYGQNQNDNNDACTYFFSGETEDYILNIDLTSNLVDVAEGFEISVEPNPANENILISIKNVQPDDFKLKLVDMKGQVVYADELKHQDGTYKKSLNVEKFAKGIYTLQLRSNSKVINRKVVVE